VIQRDLAYLCNVAGQTGLLYHEVTLALNYGLIETEITGAGPRYRLAHGKSLEEVRTLMHIVQHLDQA